MEPPLSTRSISLLSCFLSSVSHSLCYSLVDRYLYAVGHAKTSLPDLGSTIESII